MRNPFSIALKYYLLLAFICALGCGNKPTEKKIGRNFFSVKQTTARKARMYKLNKVQAVTEFTYAYKNGEINSKSKTKTKVAKYNTSGVLTESENYEADEMYKEKLTYNSDGRLLNKLITDKNDNVKERHTYQLESPTRGKSTHSFYGNYSQNEQHYICHYDEHWNITVRGEYKDGKLSIEYYDYDEESRFKSYKFSYISDTVITSLKGVVNENRLYTFEEKDDLQLIQKMVEHNDYGGIVKEVHYNNAYDKITRQETTTYYANGLPKVKEIGYKDDEPNNVTFYHYEFYE